MAKFFPYNPKQPARKALLPLVCLCFLLTTRAAPTPSGSACSENRTELSGIIASPDYPHSYSAAGVDCLWHIAPDVSGLEVAGRGPGLVLVFEKFITRESEQLFVYLDDPARNVSAQPYTSVSGKHQQGNLQPIFLANVSQAWLRFRSNSSAPHAADPTVAADQDLGFRLAFVSALARCPASGLHNGIIVLHNGIDGFGLQQTADFQCDTGFRLSGPPSPRNCTVAWTSSATNVSLEWQSAPQCLVSSSPSMPVANANVTVASEEVYGLNSTTPVSAGKTNNNSLPDRASTSVPISGRGPEGSSAGSQAGKIAAGIIVPVVTVLVVLIVAYRCYRRKYPVRMIVGRDFGKFSNPAYSRPQSRATLVREGLVRDEEDGPQMQSTSHHYQNHHHHLHRDAGGGSGVRILSDGSWEPAVEYSNVGYVSGPGDTDEVESEAERRFRQAKSYLFKNERGSDQEEEEESDQKSNKEEDKTDGDSYSAHSSEENDAGRTTPAKKKSRDKTTVKGKAKEGRDNLAYESDFDDTGDVRQELATKVSSSRSESSTSISVASVEERDEIGENKITAKPRRKKQAKNVSAASENVPAILTVDYDSNMTVEEYLNIMNGQASTGREDQLPATLPTPTLQQTGEQGLTVKEFLRLAREKQRALSDVARARADSLIQTYDVNSMSARRRSQSLSDAMPGLPKTEPQRPVFLTQSSVGGGPLVMDADRSLKDTRDDLQDSLEDLAHVADEILNEKEAVLRTDSQDSDVFENDCRVVILQDERVAGLEESNTDDQLYDIPASIRSLGRKEEKDLSVPEKSDPPARDEHVDYDEKNVYLNANDHNLSLHTNPAKLLSREEDGNDVHTDETPSAVITDKLGSTTSDSDAGSCSASSTEDEDEALPPGPVTAVGEEAHQPRSLLESNQLSWPVRHVEDYDEDDPPPPRPIIVRKNASMPDSAQLDTDIVGQRHQAKLDFHEVDSVPAAVGLMVEGTDHSATHIDNDAVPNTSGKSGSMSSVGSDDASYNGQSIPPTPENGLSKIQPMRLLKGFNEDDTSSASSLSSASDSGDDSDTVHRKHRRTRMKISPDSPKLLGDKDDCDNIKNPKDIEQRRGSVDSEKVVATASLESLPPSSPQSPSIVQSEPATKPKTSPALSARPRGLAALKRWFSGDAGGGSGGDSSRPVKSADAAAAAAAVVKTDVEVSGERPSRLEAAVAETPLSRDESENDMPPRGLAALKVLSGKFAKDSGGEVHTHAQSGPAANPAVSEHPSRQGLPVTGRTQGSQNDDYYEEEIQLTDEDSGGEVHTHAQIGPAANPDVSEHPSRQGLPVPGQTQGSHSDDDDNEEIQLTDEDIEEALDSEADTSSLEDLKPSLAAPGQLRKPPAADGRTAVKPSVTFRFDYDDEDEVDESDGDVQEEYAGGTYVFDSGADDENDIDV